MRCLRPVALNLLLFAIGALFTSCGGFFTNESSTNGTSTSSNTNTTVTTTNGTTGTTTGTTGTTTGTTGTTTGTTGTTTGTTGTTTGTTGTTAGTTGTTAGTTGTTGTTGTMGTTGTIGTVTVTNGTSGTSGTGTTGSITGTGVSSTGVGGFFAAVTPRNARNPGQVPQSGFLYTSADKAISVGRIDPVTGNLTTTHTTTAAENGGFVASMVPDAKGRFLFTSDMSGTIDVFAIDRTSGTLTSVTNGSIVLSQGGPKISVDPTGRFLYTVTDGGIAVYSIDQSSGALTAIAGSPFGGNVGNLVVVSHDGNYLYNVGNGKASVYALDSTTGTPTGSGTATSTGASPESDVAISPDGKFLFIADRSTTVKVMGIGADGSLTPLSPSPDTGHHNASIAIHPSGEFLYVANTSEASGSGGLQAFHLDRSGNLTSIGAASSGSSGSPLQIAIDASGKYLYASTPKGVTTFDIDQTTGELSSSNSRLASGNLAYSQAIATGP